MKTEDVNDVNRPGLELSQGRTIGTNTEQNSWKPLVLPGEGDKWFKVIRCRTRPNLSNKIRNKMTKIKNGNILRDIKISHWNAGSKYWKNKIEEIQYLLDTNNREILLVSEANVYKNDEEHEIVIPGYYMVTTKGLNELGHSRLVAMVKDGIHIETMDKWMDSKISSIWFKISSRGVKTLNLGAIYREHTILDQDIQTDSEQKQLERWKFL